VTAVPINTSRLSASSIKDVQVNYYLIPLPEVLSDAKHGDHTHFELVTCTITCNDGVSGTGYTYTGGKGGKAIYSLVKDDLANFLHSKDADCVEAIWEQLQYHLHYVGRGGLASFAISTIDIALWDIRCKRINQPLWRLAGGFDNRTPCYAGGIDLNFDENKLKSHIEGYLNKGFTAVNSLCQSHRAV
jgi:L-alanine-DL-glutamate epimerase-like enolase superfamily enzyme